jgi:hemoglobin-like flavoprotein
MLTKREIEIVQDDWEKVEQDANRAGTLLYDRLFALDPSLRALFTSDLEQQKSKLVTMIGSTLYGLSDPDVLMPIVRLLGQKHVRLGVKNEDYATVGVSLLWTLKQILGPAFGPENEAAWTKVYGLLAETMKAPA